jgi:hypothetical protein
MRRSAAAIGSAAYFAVAPGTFAVLVPWLVTGWQFHRPWPLLAQVAGFHRYVRNPGLPLRRRVRGLPARGARLAALAAPLDAPRVRLGQGQGDGTGARRDHDGGGGA